MALLNNNEISIARELNLKFEIHHKLNMALVKIDWLPSDRQRRLIKIK